MNEKVDESGEESERPWEQVSRSSGGGHVRCKKEGGGFAMTPYTHINDLAKEAQPPEKGILSRTLFNDERIKAVIFGFAQGEELSEHTASMPAILHFLQGDAKLTLDDDTVEASTGTWVDMTKGMRHSIQAKTPVIMLLLLMKEAGP
jgi:quercetin dioxygenase-like cupin family protein